MRGTTPFPNALIDDLMPRLKDTEWRLLCVIVRQTLGWQDKNTRRRKAHDWITQAQFVQKTGRDRAAISRALDSLVKKDYIEVRSEGNRLLHSREERRQCKGRLFYGLSPHELKDSRAIAPNAVVAPSAKSEYQGLPSNSLLQRETSKSEYRPAPKANTTKENLTKENDTKAVSVKRQVLIKNEALRKVTPKQKHLLSSNVSPGDLSHQDRKKAYASQTVGSHPMNAFLYLFGKLSAELLGYAAGMDMTPAECSRLAAFLEKTPQTHWHSLLQAYFTSEFKYVQRHRYAVSALANTCNIFLVQRQTGRR